MDLLSWISENGIMGIIKALPRNTSVRIMINSVHVYSPALMKLFNHYVKSEHFPDILKYVYTPVFLKSDKSEKSGHRPISTLSNFQKKK